METRGSNFCESLVNKTSFFSVSPYLYETKSSDPLPPLQCKDRGFHLRFDAFPMSPQIINIHHLLFRWYANDFSQDIPQYMVNGECEIFYVCDFLRLFVFKEGNTNETCGPWSKDELMDYIEFYRFVQPINSSKLREPCIQRFDKDKIGPYLAHEGQKDFLADGYEVLNIQNHLPKKMFFSVLDKGCDYKKLMKKNGDSFKCTICKKTFKDRSNCRKHIRIHNSTKTYSCKICKKYTSTSSTNMNKHLNIHPVSRSMAYKCKTCGIKFNSLSTVKKHLVAHEMSRADRINCLIPECKDFGMPIKNFKSHLLKNHHILRFSDYVKKVHDVINTVPKQLVCQCQFHLIACYKYIPDGIVRHCCGICDCPLVFQTKSSLKFTGKIIRVCSQRRWHEANIGGF